jgi:hypothetical protein
VTELVQVDNEMEQHVIYTGSLCEFGQSQFRKGSKYTLQNTALFNP